MKAESIKPKRQVREWSHDAWLEEAHRRFGDDPLRWRFVCPMCKTAQSAQDLLEAGVGRKDVDSYLAFSCVGRFTQEKGCDWTLGGLFRIHTDEVVFPDGQRRFAFAFAEKATEVPQ